MKVSLFQGVLVGIFVLAALVGLFVFATYSSNTAGTNAIGTVVIWGELPAAGMKAFLTEAGRQNPALKNVSYIAKDPATFVSGLVSAIAEDAAPDLVLTSQEDLFALRKVLTPLPSSALSAGTFTSSFVDGARIFLTADGSYGVPFLVDPLVLFENNAILSAAGVATPPATWEALSGLIPTLVVTRGASISRALIALGTYANVHDARAVLSALFLQTGVPLVSADASGALRADLGEAVKSGVPPGEAVLRFYTQFADPTKTSYTWNAGQGDSQRTFLAGDLALYLGYASEAAYFKAANPNLDASVSELPQPATARGKTTYGLLYAFAFPRGAKNAAGASGAALALAGSADLAQTAALSTGLAPALRQALSAPPANDPVAAVSYRSALYARGWLSPASSDTDSLFAAMIGNVTSGRLTLSAALTSAEGALNALLQQ